jgi:hypothetical protein
LVKFQSGFPVNAPVPLIIKNDQEPNNFSKRRSMAIALRTSGRIMPEKHTKSEINAKAAHKKLS